MSARHEAWTALRHGGNLLSPTALDTLPPLDAAPYGLADRLRGALVAFDPEKPKSEAMGALLDAVLEGATGLNVGWRKGNTLGAADAEKLLDGTILKPRRLWVGPKGETVAVFTDAVARLGVGRGRRPVARVTEFLRRRGVPLALLTNGQQWRLIWADTDATAWVEWDADRWLDADQVSDELHVLRQVLSWGALTRGEAEHSALLLAIRDTRRGQARLSKELGERVRRSVETLLKSRAPLVGPAWNEHDSADLYVAASHFVMRLVVTLFAEARELLPADNPVYHQAYGLRGLIDQLDRLTPERRRARQMAWPRLLALFKLLHEGSRHPQLAVNAYGGDLFRPGDADGDGVQRALALLEALPEPPDDDTIHRMLVLLTRTSMRVREGSGWRTVAAPVDFTELTSEYIGILYEGLLDYELHRAGEHPVVFLNLGDQPALPMDRLEEMDDKALIALVAKAKVKKQAASEDEGEEDGDDEEEVPEVEDEDAEEESENEDTPLDDDDTPDDARALARTRARAWARTAVVLAKLVKKPRGRLTADKQAAYDAQLDSAAAQLVADLKLPGELYLVRWGGTRKGAGTFYTRPQLTLPTVRRTLEPLIRDEGGAVRAPEELLALKVCDPAMGSGSFLVAALRVLTAAVVEALHTHGRIHPDNGRTAIDCALVPEGDRRLPTEGFEYRLEAVVRRAVVEHCLYGVDKDPLAVELGRVALWVETLDRDLPFTFLDHKLRCGDSLVGTWLDRFRDYPLLAFDRQSPDKKWKGVHHEADVWHEALKAKRVAATAEQAELLSGQARLSFAATSDEELKKAVGRVRRLYRDLKAVPAGRPDERARIWRTRIQPDEALARVRTAFDTWCALWFWPLDRLDDLPLPRELHAPSEVALGLVRDLRRVQRFFHWELEFPDVFTEEGAGFNAVVGNPPWEIQKPSSKEFFSNYDPLYRSYGKQPALQVQRALFNSRSDIEHHWLAYQGDFKDRGNFVRHAAEPFGDARAASHDGGNVSLLRGSQGEELHRKWRGQRGRFKGLSDPAHPFRHQGSADLNTYKMFLEVAFALLADGGQLGLLTPSGVYTDKGTGDLRRLLLEQCRWRWLYGFENRDKIFDIHRSFKFCVLIAEKGGQTNAMQAAFMRHDLDDWAEGRGVLDYPAGQIAEFSPNTLSVVEIQSPRDLTVLTKLYGNGVLLGDQGPDGWGIQYTTEFHMTNDSKLFVPRDKAEAEGFKPDTNGRWTNEAGYVLLPLYEGRMIGQLDFSEKGWVSGRGRSAEWREIAWTQKQVQPQYLVGERDAFGGRRPVPFKAAMMNIGSATNRRSMKSALVPDWPANHALAVLTPRTRADCLDLVGNLCSFAYDWVLRSRLGGLNISWFILEETPLPEHRGARAVIAALSATARPMGAALEFAEGRQPAVTRHERLRLRSMLDAIVAVLYGLNRTDFAWILKDCDHPAARLSDKGFCRQLDPKGFWRVDKNVDPQLRHTVLSVAAFDDLQAAIAAAAGEGPASRRDAGIQAFCEQHDGDGWLLPETLCIADLGLTRTVDVGNYDERSRQPQPVRSCVGPRLLDWQIDKSTEPWWTKHGRLSLLGAGVQATSEGTGFTASAPQPHGQQRQQPLGPLFERTRTTESPRPTNESTVMLDALRIKNFKAWDESHARNSVALAPITVVLGTNSSGKSSLLQALRMVKQTLDLDDKEVQLNLTEPLDLGEFSELVHGRADSSVLGVGLTYTVDGRETSVDAEFELIGGTPGVRSLTHQWDGRRVTVERSGSQTYRIESPDANHPGWDGLDLLDPAKNSKISFRPERGFEFATEVLAALGSRLRPQTEERVNDLRSLMARLHFVAAVRTGPSRFESWQQRDVSILEPDGSNAAQVLLAESRRTARHREVIKRVSRWLKQLDLADAIEVKREGTSIIYQLRVRRGDDSSNIVDVGMGVSQVFPVLVMLAFVDEGSIVMLDEPTAHLHPLAAAEMGDVIAQAVSERHLQVFVETHSEHLLRRIQVLLANERLGPNDCRLYYIGRHHPAADLVPLQVDRFGRITNWPTHLFGDAVGEAGRQMRAMVERLQEAKPNLEGGAD